MASCLPQSLHLFKSFVKTPHRKKTGTTFARLFKKSPATFIPVSAIFNTFQNGINLSETFQKVNTFQNGINLSETFQRLILSKMELIFWKLSKRFDNFSRRLKSFKKATLYSFKNFTNQQVTASYHILSFFL